MALWALGEWIPEVGEGAFVAPSADVMGQVVLGEKSSVWYGCVLRGDLEPIQVGKLTNIQDNTVIHTDRGKPSILGEGVTVGHRACIHGARIGDYALIGIGATVLNGAQVGEYSIVAAGTIVPEGKIIPPGVLAMGVPFQIKRELTEAERDNLRGRALRYVEWARQHVEWLRGLGRLDMEIRRPE